MEEAVKVHGLFFLRDFHRFQTGCWEYFLLFLLVSLLRALDIWANDGWSTQYWTRARNTMIGSCLGKGAKACTRSGFRALGTPIFPVSMVGESCVSSGKVLRRRKKPWTLRAQFSSHFLGCLARFYRIFTTRENTIERGLFLFVGTLMKMTDRPWSFGQDRLLIICCSAPKTTRHLGHGGATRRTIAAWEVSSAFACASRSSRILDFRWLMFFCWDCDRMKWSCVHLGPWFFYGSRNLESQTFWATYQGFVHLPAPLTVSYELSGSEWWVYWRGWHGGAGFGLFSRLHRETGKLRHGFVIGSFVATAWSHATWQHIYIAR